MNCKKCGFEMADNAKFCPQCGAKADEEAMSSVNTQNNDENEENDAEEVVTENGKEQEDISNETDTKFSDNKKKILIIASIAVVIIIIITVISSKSGSSDNSYTGNADTDSGYNDIDENYDDDFGNDDVVTEPETTEAATIATVDNIDIVYDDIIYDDGNGIKINKCDIIRDDTFGWYNVYVDFEKVKSNGKQLSFAESFEIDMYVYDSNGTIIESQQACYVQDFGYDEIGKKYKDKMNIYDTDAAVKIEFVGE